MTLRLGLERPGPLANAGRLGPEPGVVDQLFHIPQAFGEAAEIATTEGGGQIVERVGVARPVRVLRVEGLVRHLLGQRRVAGTGRNAASRLGTRASPLSGATRRGLAGLGTLRLFASGGCLARLPWTGCAGAR